MPRQALFLSLIILVNLLSPFLLLSPGAQAQEEYVFHDYERLYRDMQDLESQYPDLMVMSTIGEAIDQGLWNPDHPYNKRQLWSAYLTDHANETGLDLRPEIYIDGGHHGNEQAGSETAFILIKYLVERYGTDELVTWLMDNSRIYITPMINPDGNAHDTRFNTNRVDLNRNYPFEWDNQNSIWGGHGSGPASEPEVAANVAFMRSIDPVLYLTEHTGIVLLIYAWSYTYDPPPDWAMYQMAGDVISELYGIPNRQASTGLYTAAGTSKDFGYGDSLAPSWTFEVDDEQFNPISDEPVEERLADIIDANLLLMEMAAKGLLSPKPEVAKVTLPKDIESEKKFSLTFNITNPSYGFIDNGTARLVSVSRLGIEHPTQNFTLHPYNSTEIVFNLTPYDDVTFDYQLELEYHPYMIRNHTLLYLHYMGEFEVTDESMLMKALTSPFTILGIVLLLVLIGAYLYRRFDGDGAEEPPLEAEKV